MFKGQVIHLQEGSQVHAVLQSLEEDTSEFVLQQLDVGEKARVLKGALYFAVVGNHVGLIEGQQVRGRTLERYFTALLQKAGELEAGQAIILNSKFLAGDGKALDDATEMTVAAERNHGRFGAAAEEAVPEIVDHEAARARDQGSTVFDVLQTLGWTPEAIAKLESEVPDDGWIEGFFRVLIRERRRKIKPISRATINEALRNVDAGDLGLKGNGSERGGIVKLSVQRQVASHGSLLDPSDAMDQIVTALRDWSAAGKITCRFDG